MDPDEMRAQAERLREGRFDEQGGWRTSDIEAGAVALEALARIIDMLPAPRTFAESIARDFAGNLWPRVIDADTVAGIIATTFTYERVGDVWPEYDR